MSIDKSLIVSDRKKFTFKIIIVGDQGVGKTSLLKRYVENKFDNSIQHSISDNYFKSQIDFNSGKIAQLQLWDLSAKAQHRHLLTNFVSGARGALILFDMTRPLKIIDVLEWVNMVRQADMSLPVILVGTKCDLKDKIIVNNEEISHIIKVFNFCDYIETSSKENINIFKVFYKLSKEIIKIQKYKR
ncbi:MAG: Rab family GTPase [Promethearchaeota archaeon]